MSSKKGCTAETFFEQRSQSGLITLKSNSNNHNHNNNDDDNNDNDDATVDTDKLRVVQLNDSDISFDIFHELTKT